MDTPVRLTIWNEFRQEQEEDAVRSIYPDGIHMALANALQDNPFIIRFGTLDDDDHGLPDALLSDTDVLIWWGHRHHHEVEERIADRVVREVRSGMGFIALHSAHFSKPFTRLMGTSCSLQHRVADEWEEITTLLPDHPLAENVPPAFRIEQEEMYGEPFDVPEPDDIVFRGTFAGGETFPAGACFTCARGRVFYFQPGHETYPIYSNPVVLQIIENAIYWTAQQR